ncbi:MAG: hypothetical protein KJ970_04970 [Candidatus Eisenbacteria bacterium]|uniref:Uncharacterized protein n=1 Tax=Eiseniibacteriota bacterium TaxID=2212470 RepID=A0A948RSM6_UNCEI|nr:hypothetical protein [Candidatus Eisenbacteria bacterium]MBU1949240.1 hypothetical protein [Candidatus Eisenbacteria bacterium]MBU2690260.1 hypothetical protein [Candidatus Eisenbacteria bacterium]
MDATIEDRIFEAAEASGRFHSDAFYLILRALEVAQQHRGQPGHISGRTLLEQIKEMVRREYGPMALTVLHHMGLYRTEDVGDLVFLMVEKGLLRKRDEDCLDDFKDVFDFEEIFEYKW